MASITYTIRRKAIVRALSHIDVNAIATAILGHTYDVSIVFCGIVRAQQLNQTYRNKSYTPNVLSFPIDSVSGEIFICIPVASTEANIGGVTLADRVAYLLIHGCAHLRGLDHGTKLDALEYTICRQFDVPHPDTCA
jgi:probable rRNA maturation factor